MDQKSLKIGLARQFIKKSDILVEQTIDGFTSEFAKYNRSSRSWQRLTSYFKDSKNNCAIHQSEFGSKKNPCIGITHLHASNRNEVKNWDEELLISSGVYFSKNPFNIVYENGENFNLSMHVFERIFERHSNKNMKDFAIAFSVIREELKYLTLISCILKCYFIYLSQEEKNLFNNNNYFIIPVPSVDGIFISHLYRETLCVRTFLSLREMSSEQKEIREGFINSIDPYISSNLPYLLQSIINRHANIYEEMEFNLLICVILSDIKPILEKIISSIFINNLSQTIKNNIKNINVKWSKLILNRIEDFIKDHETFEGLTKNLHAQVRKCSEEDTILKFMRSFKITLASGKISY